METREAFQEINEHIRLCDRTGQAIRFSSPEAIGPQLLGLMDKVRNQLRTNADLESVARAFSIFWLGFIAIHPFNTGNGKTAKAYLEKKAAELGFSLRNIYILDQILLQGDTSRDLSLLQIYFKSNLTINR